MILSRSKITIINLLTLFYHTKNKNEKFILNDYAYPLLSCSLRYSVVPTTVVAPITPSFSFSTECTGTVRISQH